MRWIRTLGRTVPWAALSTLAFTALAYPAEVRVGAVQGVHGPPSLAAAEPGCAILAAYVVREKTGADIFVWRLGDVPASSKWPKEGLLVCASPGDQLGAVTVSDGAGGAIVAWTDPRSGKDRDVYAQHVLASGLVDPAWPEAGVEVCVAAGTQGPLRMVPDQAGGALLVWEDRRSGECDVYLHHVLGNGKLDPTLPATGRPMVAERAIRVAPAIARDGSGGAIVTWEELGKESASDVYAQHILPSGGTDKAWPKAGLAISAMSGDQTEPSIVSDGTGGAVVLWSDDSGTGPRLRAHRVLASGTLDQRWPEGGKAVCTVDGLQRQPDILADGLGGAFVAWQDRRVEGAESVVLQHVKGWGELDPAWPEEGLAVSTAKGQLVSPRLVLGNDAMFVTWLDRGVPGDVRGYAQRVSRDGRIDPAWPSKGAALSRAAVDDLVVSPMESGEAMALWRVAASWTIHGSPLTAEPPALETAPTPEVRAVTMLLAPRPNPARSTVTFRFSLASRLPARLSVFDVQGRRVATPLNRILDPGPHQVIWNRADGKGNRVRSGIYFLHFDADGKSFTRRFALVR